MADMGMVERVKTAIAGEIDCVDWTAPDGTMDHAARLDAIALYATRAAIEAMREPTDQMVLAGVPEVQSDSPQTDARECWAAMIDAILKEEGNG